jgi:hypothetical protein
VSRTWLELPANYDTPTSAGRPKYPINGSALVLYKGPKAYAFFRDQDAQQDELMQYHDVRLLSRADVRKLEENFPFPIPASADGNAEMRLGDLVHQLTTRVHIGECAGCRKRRRILNRVVIWGWWNRSRS